MLLNNYLLVEHNNFFECKEVWVVRWGYDYRICAASVADLAGLLAGNVMDLKPCQINLDLPL